MSTLANLPGRVAKLERADDREHERQQLLDELGRKRDRNDARRLVLVGLALTLGGLVGQVAIALLLRGSS